MAMDIFLKIDGVDGESKGVDHEGEIDVLDWSWGMTQLSSGHVGGGAGHGKVSVQDLVITKHVDKASPILVKFCCTGEHFATAKLTLRKAGGTPLEYLTLEMERGIVTEVSPGAGANDDHVVETVRLNFETFTYTYTPQEESGAGGADIPWAWDVAKNAPL